MTRVDTDSMTITINGTDYSNYINSISVTIGGPMYTYKEVWNGRKKRAVIGYNEHSIEMSMLMDSATKTFIDGLTTQNTSYTIVIGESGVYQRTFSNMYAIDTNDSIISDDGLQMIIIKFISEGLPSNIS